MSEDVDRSGGDECGLVSAAMDRFLASGQLPATPFVVVDLDVVVDRYRSLVAALPGVELYYAVKANPDAAVLARLAAEGCRFDVASPGEIERCRSLGVPPDRISFGNTIKKRNAIAQAHDLGIRDFAVDAPEELRKVIDAAPNSTVAIRLLCDPPGASWPLSGKFGCPPELAVQLGIEAQRAGLGVGLSFHVGSQQHIPAAWDGALADVARVVTELDAAGVHVDLLNIGGGFPGSYGDGAPAIEEYGHSIIAAIDERLGAARPARIAAEPGRYLVADAGLIRAEVVLVSPPKSPDGPRWVYLDVGVFSGLVETLGEAIRYPLRVVGADPGAPTGPAVLAGPTCDSLDVMAEAVPYELPLDLAAGAEVELLTCGAYTTSYSSIEFNGFPPLHQVVLGA